MRSFGFVLCLLAFHVTVAQKEAWQKVDSLLASPPGARKPGGVLCVMQGGEVVYEKAIGLADIRNGVPNSSAFKHDIASLAKQFTGMCIALLEEQGKISPGDPLSQYYPEFQLPEGIQIRHLLSHTSGIREAYVLATLSGKTNLRGELRQRFNTKAYLLEVLARERDLNFEPGTELAYTNINYILLGDIVERISKQPLYRFADSAIFKPLGMTHTFFRYEPDMEFPGEAKGYLVARGKYKPRKATGGILGDGKMVTTIGDLVKWEQNLRHNRLGLGKQSLVEKLCASSSFNNGELTHYGYGFWNRDYQGLNTISHGGDDGRFTSFILKFPSQDLVIICLANSSLYSNTEGTAYQIADLLLEKQFPEPRQKPFKYDYIKMGKDEMLPLTGIYKRVDENGLAQLRRITLTDSLYVSASYEHQGNVVRPVEQNFFVMTNRAGNQVKFRFEKDTGGWFFDEQFKDNKPWRFRRIESTKVSGQPYAGTYVNKSTSVRLKVKAKKGDLLAKKGVIKIPLITFGPDQFYAIRNDALFIFQRNPQGEIQLKVNASDFRNFVFERRK